MSRWTWTTLLATSLVGWLSLASAARAADPDEGHKLFIKYGCGWCHEDGGRRAAKGPALMNTTRSDDFILNRIATGKQGKMPAFGGSLNLDQVDALIAYIRSLKPDESSPKPAENG